MHETPVAQSGRHFAPLSALMSKVGYFLFYWSALEQALTQALCEARGSTFGDAGRVSGTFQTRLDLWRDLTITGPGNENKAERIGQIAKQALSLRKIRNTIVHGLKAGNSMPKEGPCHIECFVGGYDKPTGEIVRYSIDDLEHFAQTADACRRGFRHIDAFNYLLDSRS